MKDWEGPIAFSEPHLKIYAEMLAEVVNEPSYFTRFLPPPVPRPWWRRQLGKRTWRLRGALRGLRMGWKGELDG